MPTMSSASRSRNSVPPSFFSSPPNTALPGLGHEVDQRLRPADIDGLARRAHMDPVAVHESALARQCPVGLVLCRAFEHAGQRAAVLDHRDADAPGMQAIEKASR